MRWRAPLLAFVAGAVQVLAFAPFGWFPLSFLSLAALFALWRSATPRAAAMLGYLWGLGCFLGGVSWVYVSMHDVGGMPAPVAALMTLLFSAYLALYPAVAGWLAARFRADVWWAPFTVAAAWTLTELLRGYIATGFPWLAVGYAQSPPSPLAGYAPLLGVYGVGFAAVAVSAACAQMFSVRRWLPAALGICIALPLVGLGLRLMTWTVPQGRPFTAALLQGDVPQSLKWDPEHLNLSLRVYAQLAQAHPAKLLVLPETAIPLLFEEIPKRYLQLLTADGQHLLLGAAASVGQAGTSNGSEQNYANGAMLLNPQLQHDAYFKRHLVPFGEFVPAGFRWFLDLMRIPMSDFSAGPAEQRPLVFDGQTIAPNICYEDLFGEELIRDVPQATLLVNLSNTAWFGHSLAQPQHLQIAQMRAMETGRMILRATNTGMTAAVKPDGTIAAVLLPFTRDALQVTAQGYAGLTPYVRIGNLGVGVLILFILGVTWRAKQRAESVRTVT